MTLARFAPHFNTLPTEAVHLVYALVRLRYPTRIPTDIPDDGYALYLYCAEAGLCHADVLRPLFRTHEKVGIMALETLVGHPIQRKQPVTIEVKQTRNRTQKIDNRVIIYLHPDNPKKPGTRAHRLWELYRLGMTADEFVAAGGRRSALRYDTEHGYIQLGAAGATRKIKRAVLDGLVATF
jgi:hypothetical protein